MRIGIIVDNMRVARWQAMALGRLDEAHLYFFYNCTNSRPSRRRPRHSLYYLLNLGSVRNRLTRMTALPDLPVGARIDFEAQHEGAWQRLPDSLLERIRRDGPEVIVKFGMGLLRVPNHDALPVPILSYHHGDPGKFRGRPAGFHEMDQDRPVMGQVVQILSNSLDAGPVVAFAETKIHPHSYRATLLEAYRHSPLILDGAIRNAAAGRSLPRTPPGPIYRLPGNLRVVLFCLRMAARWIRRMAYGAFYEKAWRVAVAKADPAHLIDANEADPLPKNDWLQVRKPHGYRFLADCFFHPSGDGLLVEALHEASNKGEILHVGGDRAVRLTRRGLHFSYPATVEEAGTHYLFPETADWSPQSAFPIDALALGAPIDIAIPDRPRLLDPTPYRRGDCLFLFANRDDEGGSVLRLWHADALAAPFTEHPSSPIRISPAGARMAGGIFEVDGALFRIGQDFSGQYGDGIILFRIDSLNRIEYREAPVRALRFNGVRGPHTVNFRGGQVAFDYYVDRFSPFAGFRRLRQAR
jgi:hypothetical protein